MLLLWLLLLRLLPLRVRLGTRPCALCYQTTLREARLAVGFVKLHRRGRLTKNHVTAQVLKVGLHGEGEAKILSEKVLGGNLMGCLCGGCFGGGGLQEGQEEGAVEREKHESKTV